MSIVVSPGTVRKLRDWYKGCRGNDTRMVEKLYSEGVPYLQASNIVEGYLRERTKKKGGLVQI